MELAGRKTVELKILSHVSGEACVAALLRAGFRLKHRGSGLALLARNGKIVMVPDVEVIDRDMLKAILRSADIDEEELARHLLNAPTKSGFFSRVDPRERVPDSTNNRSRR
jgi:hypothetical protein